MNNKQKKDILQFLCETMLLKRTVRSGWSVVGVREAEKVSSHSFQCGVLGFILSRLEKVSFEKVLLMSLFNDLHEARITDLHKMAQRYIDVTEAENKAFFDQVKNLPKKIKQELTGLRKEYVQQITKESIIARDADILECLLQAKEYYEQGFKQAAAFMKKSPKLLKTKTAKELWKFAKENNISDWWQCLAKISR